MPWLASDSCETQLVTFIQELAKTNNNNIQLQMYNCNGFDKVTHKRLLSKLNYYGIEYNTLKWIGFLTSCTQTVIIDGVQSKNSQNIWRSSRNSFGSYSVPCVYKWLQWIHQTCSTLWLFTYNCIIWTQQYKVKKTQTNYKRTFHQQQNRRRNSSCCSIQTSASSQSSG